jgi:hypothetical protein
MLTCGSSQHLRWYNVDFACLWTVLHTIYARWNSGCWKIDHCCCMHCSPSPSPAVPTCQTWQCPEATLVNAANATWSPPSNRACCLVRVRPCSIHFITYTTHTWSANLQLKATHEQGVGSDSWCSCFSATDVWSRLSVVLPGVGCLFGVSCKTFGVADYFLSLFAADMRRPQSGCRRPATASLPTCNSPQRLQQPDGSSQ